MIKEEAAAAWSRAVVFQRRGWDLSHGLGAVVVPAWQTLYGVKRSASVCEGCLPFCWQRVAKGSSCNCRRCLSLETKVMMRYYFRLAGLKKRVFQVCCSKQEGVLGSYYIICDMYFNILVLVSEQLPNSYYQTLLKSVNICTASLGVRIYHSTCWKSTST